MLCKALASASLALLVAPLFTRMPAPYDDVTAIAIPPERAARMPGGKNGSAVPARFVGPYALNTRLKSATRLFSQEISGSECVAVTNKKLIMLDRQGYVFVASPVPEGGPIAYQLDGPSFYLGPGRPLGFHVQGRWLYVCCSLKGLLRLHLDSGETQLLSNALSPLRAAPRAPPEPLNYANDLDVASDGSVYFTSSSDHPVARNANGDFYDTMRGYLLSTTHGAANGRLLLYSPKTRRTTEVLGGLAYANGVALSRDERWVAVVETNHARVLRHWLKGERAGETEVLVESLPGTPDGISRSPDGGFWLALVAPLSPLAHGLAPYRLARQLLSHLVQHLPPLASKPWGGVVKLDADGHPVAALYDPDGTHVSSVSAAVEDADGRLFLGNLGGRGVSVLQL